MSLLLADRSQFSNHYIWVRSSLFIFKFMLTNTYHQRYEFPTKKRVPQVSYEHFIPVYYWNHGSKVWSKKFIQRKTLPPAVRRFFPSKSLENGMTESKHDKLVTLHSLETSNKELWGSTFWANFEMCLLLLEKTRLVFYEIGKKTWLELEFTRCV